MAARYHATADQLSARQMRYAAREKYLAGRRTRKDDTRRKILVGAVVLARVEKGKLEEAMLRRWLDVALVRKDDRALFGLYNPR